MSSIVEADSLSKNFGKTRALNNISYHAEKGEILGFIGPDGSGKTTNFRILTTLLRPSSGKASIFGLDSVKNFREIRPRLGYMPGRFSLYQDLSVEENLQFFASIFGSTIEKNYALIKDIYIMLEPFSKRPAGKLSGGMKQKLALSCALIHKPELLILDEPTTGVDAVSRKEFWDMLIRLKEQGITILVSTPYMDEASMCDRVALIQDGVILNIDTPDTIVKNFDRQLFSVKSTDRYKLLQVLGTSLYCHSVYPFGEFMHYIDKRNEISVNDISNFLNDNGIVNTEVKIAKPNIEDCFMELMLKNERK
ncbi:MAG: transporter ATP-binding protein [Ignavibacteria bacterium]|nr:transporter ATP-binding protein [Ignavibacteria bacterium]